MKFRLVFVGKRLIEGNKENVYQLCSDATLGLYNDPYWFVVAEGTVSFIRDAASRMKCFTSGQLEEIDNLLDKWAKEGGKAA